MWPRGHGIEVVTSEDNHGILVAIYSTDQNQKFLIIIKEAKMRLNLKLMLRSGLGGYDPKDQPHNFVYGSTASSWPP